MRIKSKKTGDIHHITAESWIKMGKREESSQRRYIVLDREDVQPKNEHIEIKRLVPKTEQVSVKQPLEIAIYEGSFDSKDYYVEEIVEFLKGLETEDYRKYFGKDKRKEIKKLYPVIKKENNG